MKLLHFNRRLSPLGAGQALAQHHADRAAARFLAQFVATGRRLDLHVPAVPWRQSVVAAMLIIAGLALGILLSAESQTAPATEGGLRGESRREDAAVTIQQLEAEQAELKKIIADLREQIAAQQRLTTEHGSLQQLSDELRQERVLAGMTALTGHGVRVVLDDSAAKTVPPGEDPAMYIVHEYQLRDVINQLWLAGAEAIALNGERIVGSTSVYCVGSTILVNDTRLSPPYEIIALGDPAALESAIQSPSNLVLLKNRVKTYGIQLSVARADQLKVPSYHGSLTLRHATLGAIASEPAPTSAQGKTNAQ